MSETATDRVLNGVFSTLRRFYGLTGLRRVAPVHQVLRRCANAFVDVAAQRQGLLLDDSNHTSITSKFRFVLKTLDRESIVVCKRLIRPGMTVLDIGAHAGYYTRVFSELAGAQGRVFAFEPHPDNFRMLVTNVAGSENVVTVQAAVSDRTGRVELHEMVGSSQHGLHDLSRFLPHFEGTGSVLVDVTSVDEFLRVYGNPPVDFVKMDIEGSEPAAIVGMESTIARSSDLAMIVEFNPPALAGVGVGSDEFLRQLQDLGFDVSAILGNRGLVPIEELEYPKDDPGWYVNLLCLRRECDERRLAPSC